MSYSFWFETRLYCPNILRLFIFKPKFASKHDYYSILLFLQMKNLPTMQRSIHRLTKTCCSYIFSSNIDQFWSDVFNFDQGICAEFCALNEDEFYTYTYPVGKTPNTPMSEENEKELILFVENKLYKSL